MYYESRIYEIINTGSALDAARKIKNGSIQSYQVATWLGAQNQYQFFAVPDGHLDNPMLELAILRKDAANPDAPYEQVESITNGWIQGANKLGKHFLDAEESDWIMVADAQLLTGPPKGDEVANFTCGCCGTWFKGNVKEQLKFDQDAGYGICDNCANHY